ncbi:MAG: sulfatase-like hydrolase/transferase [Verrucomicrobiae bacterium]|nr:sulfatase-like hydrolase/transferase [Verrucomicrobiae bacterium]
MKRQPSLSFLCLGFLVLTSTLSSIALSAERPNILFLFTDDQAPWAFGRSGDPNANTPNLDKLASQGAYLTRSFTVTPVCSPSRISLMTSRYGTEVGITDWIKPKDRFFKDNPEEQPGIDPAMPNLAKTLSGAGYETALIGKYHIGERPECHPTKVGFDYFMGFLDGGTTPDNPKLEKDGQYQPFQGLTVDIFTEHALEFLAKKHESPFFLAVHFRSPHAKWLPVAPEDWAPFESMDPELSNPDYPGLDVERAKQMMREYLASVRGVDRNVGRILAKLDELKLSENTIIIYSADHGYNMGHNGIWHKGNGHWLLKKEALPPATENIPTGQRPNLYDNSVLIPTLVRWPGVIEEGTVIDQTVSNLDWFPTFADLAGADIPAGLRGHSIVPLLKGDAPVDWENEIFLQYSTKHQSHTHMRGWRSNHYKLIRDFLNPERDEFYDLEADPGENTNLIGELTGEQKAVAADFDAKLRARMKEIDDPALELAH